MRLRFIIMKKKFGKWILKPNDLDSRQPEELTPALVVDVDKRGRITFLE